MKSIIMRVYTADEKKPDTVYTTILFKQPMDKEFKIGQYDFINGYWKPLDHTGFRKVVGTDQWCNIPK